MSQNKTRPTGKPLATFFNQLPEKRKYDCQWLDAMMERVTGEKAKRWGDSILGYGNYHYRYRSGSEGDWFLCGFASRKQALTLYLLCDLQHKELNFDGLGTYTTGVGCLYIKRLSDINLEKLETLVTKAVHICRQQAATTE